MATLRTDLWHMRVRTAVEQFGTHQRPFVTGVSGLTTQRTFCLALWRRRGWRLDDIRGRWFGGSARVFACAGQTLLQFGNTGTQRINLRLLGPHLGSQTLAARTVGFPCHETALYEK